MTSLLSIFAKGGAAGIIIMGLIFICSLIAVAIIVEKFLILRKARINASHFILRVKNLILKDNVEDAIELCSRTEGSLPKVLKRGITKHHRDKREVQETIEGAGREEVYNLEKNLSYLATISGVAPLLGFLGTVTGMIIAFMQIERLAGNVNATVLAGGIWAALLTTAFGLSVGIPSYFFYNILLGKVQRIVYDMEVGSNEIIELLYSEKEDEFKDREQITHDF